jgi:hypothetical protein
MPVGAPGAVLLPGGVVTGGVVTGGVVTGGVVPPVVDAPVMVTALVEGGYRPMFTGLTRFTVNPTDVALAWPFKIGTVNVLGVVSPASQLSEPCVAVKFFPATAVPAVVEYCTLDAMPESPWRVTVMVSVLPVAATELALVDREATFHPVCVMRAVLVPSVAPVTPAIRTQKIL